MNRIQYLISHVSSPFLWLILWLGICSVYLLWKRTWSPRAAWLTATATLLLALLSTPAASYFALGTLEWGYPPIEPAAGDRRPIVVLSGGILPPDDVRRQAVLSGDTIHRCVAAAELYHRGPPRPIVLSGGRVLADMPGPTLAEAMREWMLKLGIAPEMLRLEDRSRNTRENAARCRELLVREGADEIVLVTHASHMPRAARCFRRQGFGVAPFACLHLATRPPATFVDFVPNPTSAREVQVAYHEWLGLLWYRLRGWI
jgi:uncharacterized SAM-binding protein YcdF (DUF218 family)